VTIEAAEVGSLPPAIEVAAYRIIIEAVTNVVRHADARTCTVRIERERDALVLRVADDGAGIGPGAVGVGTRSMYERAAEVGGELLVGEGPTGGTLVTASLPVPPAAAAADPIAGSVEAGRTPPAEPLESAAGS
jgi:signal transduction histidine kinase